MCWEFALAGAQQSGETRFDRVKNVLVVQHEIEDLIPGAIRCAVSGRHQLAAILETDIQSIDKNDRVVIPFPSQRTSTIEPSNTPNRFEIHRGREAVGSNSLINHVLQYGCEILHVYSDRRP